MDNPEGPLTVLFGDPSAGERLTIRQDHIEVVKARFSAQSKSLL